MGKLKEYYMDLVETQIDYEYEIWLDEKERREREEDEAKELEEKAA